MKGNITIALPSSQRIIKYEMDEFPEIYKLPKLTQEETDKNFVDGLFIMSMCY